MKHIFIINPKAGKKDISNDVITKLREYKGEFTYKIYITSHKFDALYYIKDLCANLKEETTFYACGGDGTLNEVVNGVIGCKLAYVACFPSGSGNDFIKVFGKKEDFLNLDSLINGKPRMIDAIKVNNRYTINICNLGFDAFVADNMIKFKNKPFIKGKTAYSVAVFYSLLFKMKTKCKITVDNNIVLDDFILLASFANGNWYGGGYHCAPRAKVNDGLVDVCIAKAMSRFSFISMIKKYKLGVHLDDPKTMQHLTYLQGKKIEISSEKDIIYCLDGEVDKSNSINIEVCENAINFIIPQNLS